MTASADATFIAITGYGQEHTKNESSAAGFDHHLVKPPDTSRLMELLEHIQAA